MLNLLIGDIMNDHPICVKAEVSVRNVAHLLLRYRINGVLVMDNADSGKLLGVFTTRDLLDLMDEAISKGHQKMQSLKEVGSRPVSDFLKKDLTVLQVTDNGAKAVGLMHKKGAITVPVFEGDKLVGVIGRHDIINIAFA